MRIKNLTIPLIAVGVIIVSFAACAITDSLIEVPDGDRTVDNGIVSHTPYVPEEPFFGNDPNDETGVVGHGEFRAVWVASVLNLDFPTRPGLTAAAMKREIDAIVANTAEMGLTAVVLQVRPAGDAFYKSEIFPWSHWLSGEQGVGIEDFDPLEYWLDVCHANDIELHAWINPYRIIHTVTNSSDIETLAENHPVRLNPDLAIPVSAGSAHGLMLDPGLPEARQLVIDGVIELCENYDIDGIHFDDYFYPYPGTDFDDSVSFDRYGNGMELEDWRRENVNELVRGVQAAIYVHNQTQDKNIRWGISPFAIWKNDSSDPLGTATRGLESYDALYTDIRTWVMEEWVDYICPQIYWYIGYDIADFETVFHWWEELCAPYNVDFYVGHAAYKQSEDGASENWRGEMARQLEMIALSDNVEGSVFFRYYEGLRGATGRSVMEFYAEKDGFPEREPVFDIEELAVGFPYKDVSISGSLGNISGYNVLGTSFPDRPLYLNGEEVATRTAEGFFHVFAPLQPGDNVFTFSQEGVEDAVRIITFNTPGGDSDATPDPNHTPTPAPTPSPSPTPPPITTITTLDYATVTSNEAWVYSANTTDNGIGYMLEPGMRDRIVASSNNLYKLSCGIWIRRDAISVRRENAAIINVLTDGVYRSGQDYDTLEWSSEEFPAAVVTYNNDTLNVSFGMSGQVPLLELPDNLEEETLFQSARSGVADGIPYHAFTIKEDAGFDGYYIEFDEDEGVFRLMLKKRKALADGDMPLDGITIMLDPGHGGDSSGALGPLGFAMAEKDIVLTNAFDIAERLEALGATVELTRSDDTDVSLQERVNISRDVKPDLFISLHNNSIAETTNAQSVRGFTIWYQNSIAVDFADTALDVLHFINPGTNRQNKVLNHANFFVCRPQWAPHVLLESSFICNISDFVWLIDPVQQERYADATVDAVLDYFAAVS